MILLKGNKIPNVAARVFQRFLGGYSRLFSQVGLKCKLCEGYEICIKVEIIRPSGSLFV